jgi:hypothetical protein
LQQNGYFGAGRKGQGLTDELGHATLTNIKFVNVTTDYFDAGPTSKQNKASFLHY